MSAGALQAMSEHQLRWWLLDHGIAASDLEGSHQAMVLYALELLDSPASMVIAIAKAEPMDCHLSEDTWNALRGLSREEISEWLESRGAELEPGLTQKDMTALAASMLKSPERLQQPRPRPRHIPHALLPTEEPTKDAERLEKAKLKEELKENAGAMPGEEPNEEPEALDAEEEGAVDGIESTVSDMEARAEVAKQNGVDLNGVGEDQPGDWSELYHDVANQVVGDSSPNTWHTPDSPAADEHQPWFQCVPSELARTHSSMCNRLNQHYREVDMGDPMQSGVYGSHGKCHCAPTQRLEKISSSEGFTYSHHCPSTVTCPEIRQIIQHIIATGEPFCDPDLDPDKLEVGSVESVMASSLQPCSGSGLGWHRPHEIMHGRCCGNPAGDACTATNRRLLFQDRCPSFSSMRQGQVGDCWFVSSLAVVAATSPRQIGQRIVEANPELGYYVFSFLKEEQWKQVIVDDRILTMQLPHDPTRVFPVFSHAVGDGEFPEDGPMWVSLMEKAYAKLHGGYRALSEGHQAYAVRDLTGAAPKIMTRESGYLHSMPAAVFTRFYRIQCERGAKLMIGLSCDKSNPHPHPRAHPKVEGVDRIEGIEPNHMYSLIRVVDVPGLPVLGLIRNPWGGGFEWTGAWSDRDLDEHGRPRWSLENRSLAEYEPSDRPDGEFMMPFQEMQRVFDIWELNYLYPDQHARLTIQSRWQGATAAGAGGEEASIESLLRNPQFVLSVFEESENPQVATTVSVVLIQEDVRYKRISRPHYPISIMCFKSLSTRTFLRRQLSLSQAEVQPLTSSGAHLDTRSVTVTLVGLEPGEYLLVPSTYHPGAESDFSLVLHVSDVVSADRQLPSIRELY
eukprot:TRINITY_DN6390_c0_g1_i1.p1 TRINITY_DN6390_c0_g1~~TRINITY_DN6390_c0_g1_i1.p1  ORF type:complete len:849 (-),score=150.64 TRINITY_DN6390_c0_g1_i1:322-2868(-)